MGKQATHDIDRRKFLKQTSAGTVAYAAMTHGPAVFAAGYSPNEVIGVGHIGVGVRGGQLVTDIAGEPDKDRPGILNTQVKAISEVYKGHMEKGLKLSANANCKSYLDYKDMLADKDIDAVIIATPDHWHSQMVIDAAYAGKDIYVEKCWTRTIPEAKAMYKAVKFNKTVMQLGHDRSSAAALQASELILSGILGELVMVESGCFRNRVRGKDEWRWYGWYNNYERPNEKETEQSVDWNRFLGNAPYHPFSMERFWHWRCYWDYGTGAAGDLLSHSFDYINYILQLGIPHSVNTTGAMHVLDDGRECPDFWHVTMDYPERKLTLIDTITFNSQLFAPSTHGPVIRGKDALMKMDENNFEIFAEENSTKYNEKYSNEIRTQKPFRTYDPSATPEQPSHLEDFFHCMRNRKQPKDNEDEAFVEAVACIMSVISFFEKRTVVWDADRQEVV